MISELKVEAIAGGREESTWFMYHNHVDIDPERAFVMGPLHDVGAMEEEKQQQRFHGIIGYEMLKDQDDQVARGALLHMFPQNKISDFEKVKKMFLGRREDYDFVKNYADRNEINDYDRLVQLSDSLADSRGMVTIEQRANDYAKRHGVEIPPEMLQPRLDLKKYFDAKSGGNVYDLFRNIKSDVWVIKNNQGR